MSESRSTKIIIALIGAAATIIGALIGALVESRVQVFTVCETNGVCELPTYQDFDLLHSDFELAGQIMQIAVSSTNDLLAAVSYDDEIELWRISTGDFVETLGHEGGYSTAFSRNGRYLATTSKDDVVRLWDIKDGRVNIRHTLDHAGERVVIVAFSQDGAALATGTTPLSSVADSPNVISVVRIWDVISGKELQRVQLTSPRQPDQFLADLEYLPDGRTFALTWFCEPDNRLQITLWNIQERKEFRNLSIDIESCAFPLFPMVLSPDGSLLAIATLLGETQIWDLEQQGRPQVIPQGTMALAFSPDATVLALADRNGDVRLWRRDSGEFIKILTSSGETITSLTFSPDGRFLAMGDANGLVRVFEQKVKPCN